MKDQTTERVASLQNGLRSAGIDAAVIMDRENLIYYAGVDDIECGSLIVPADSEPELICLWLDAGYLRENSGIAKITPYFFPNENVGEITARKINELGFDKPTIGFTKYFITLKDYLSLREAVNDMVVGDISELCYRIRSVKSVRELEYMEKACGFLAYGMQAAVEAVRPGVKETDIIAEADYAMRKAGSQGPTFRMQALRHDRQLLAHPYAGDYTIENNQPVVIHLGASYKGYSAKMCRTVFLGKVNNETLDIYGILTEAQRIAMDHLKPGIKSFEVYDKVYQYVKSKGYGDMFLSTIGYGVGIRQSEFFPVIGANIEHVFSANMVVDVLLSTIYKPKAGGPRITDTILIGENGARKLTSYKSEPIFK